MTRTVEAPEIADDLRLEREWMEKTSARMQQLLQSLQNQMERAESLSDVLEDDIRAAHDAAVELEQRNDERARLKKG